MAFNIGINRYPEDLGKSHNYHYIIFHICEQTKTSYKSPAGLTDNGGETSYAKDASLLAARGALVQKAVEKNKEYLYQVGDAIASSSIGGALLSIGGAVTPEAAKNVAKPFLKSLDQTITDAGNLNFVRTVRRTSETIALYMPDTLNFIQTQGYSDLNLGNNPVTALFTGGKAVADTIKQFSGNGYDSKVFGEQLAKNINPYFVNAVGNAFGDVGKAIAAAGQGFVANPMIEVLYTSPSLREFRYDFVFYPRSSSEARTVQKIIQLFSFHQAPEILPGASGYFLIPPSEFDIEFYYNGGENVNIPKLSTCVLTNMDVDYAPNGWAAYQVGNGETSSIGGTGMPVGIKMSLSFKETSIVTKASRQFSDLNFDITGGNAVGTTDSGMTFLLNMNGQQIPTEAEIRAFAEQSQNDSKGGI
jgi:hypothetical protein